MIENYSYATLAAISAILLAVYLSYFDKWIVIDCNEGSEYVKKEKKSN